MTIINFLSYKRSVRAIMTHTDLVFEFAIEVYSDDMTRRDIKPGSKLFTRNLYQTTGKKKEIEKEIDTNIIRFKNIKDYLTNRGDSTPGSLQKLIQMVKLVL